MGLLDHLVDTILTKVGENDKSSQAGKNLAKIGVKYVRGISKRETIRSKAAGTICEYPMLVSTAISTETASILTKALEHEYMNLLLLAFNSIVETEIKTSESIAEVLKQFHTPIGYRSIFDEDYIINEESKTILRNLFEDTLNELDNKDNMYLEDVKVSFTEDNDINKLNEDLCVLSLRKANTRTLNEMSVPYDVLNEAGKGGGSKPKPKPPKDKDPVEYHEKSSKYVIEAEKLDWRKVNSLAPTILKINLRFVVKDKSNNNSKVDTTEKVMRIGVKGYVHELKSTDIIMSISKGMDDSNVLLKFVKWRIGEKKFFRDIVFEVDRQKEAAKSSMGMNKKNNASPLWNILINMGKGNRAKNILNFKGDDKYPYVATASLIIDKSEVEHIKNVSESKLDLMYNCAHIQKLLNTFFLLTFAIVDENAKLVYIYNEENKCYETHTLNSLRAFGKEEIDMNNLKSLLK